MDPRLLNDKGRPFQSDQGFQLNNNRRRSILTDTKLSPCLSLRTVRTSPMPPVWPWATLAGTAAT